MTVWKFIIRWKSLLIWIVVLLLWIPSILIKKINIIYDLLILGSLLILGRFYFNYFYTLDNKDKLKLIVNTQKVCYPLVFIRLIFGTYIPSIISTPMFTIGFVGIVWSIMLKKRINIRHHKKDTLEQAIKKDLKIQSKTYRKKFWKSLSWCLLPNEPIYTNYSVKEISNVTTEDKVLTTKGFNNILGIYKRDYDGEIINIYPSYQHNIKLTPSHLVRIFRWKGYINKSQLRNGFRERLDNNFNKYLLAASLSRKGIKTKEIAKELNIPYITVYNWIKGNSKARIPPTLKWIKAKDIKKGDVVVFPRFKEIQDKESICISDVLGDILVENGYVYTKNKNQYASGFKSNCNPIPDKLVIDNDLLRLFGYYIAEGCGTRNLLFCLNQNEKIIIEDICTIMKNKFNLIPYKHYSDRNRLVLDFGSKILAKFFVISFGCTAKHKHIPKWVMLLPNEKLNNLFIGMYRGDGYFGENLSYSTVSKMLAYQLFLLYNKLGFVSSIVHFIGKRKIFPEQCKQPIRDEYNVVISGKQRTKLKSIFNDYPSNFEPTHNSTNFGWMDNDFIYLPIRKIKIERYKGKVYNLQTQDNTFVSSFLVHNCGGFVTPIFPFFTMLNKNWKKRLDKEALIHENIHLYYLQNGWMFIILFGSMLILVPIYLLFNSIFLMRMVSYVYLVCTLVLFEFITFKKTNIYSEKLGIDTRKWNKDICIRYFIIYSIQAAIIMTIVSLFLFIGKKLIEMIV